jgi:hypothetical protein
MCVRLLNELQARREWDCWDRFQKEGVHEFACPEYLLKGDE